MCPENKNNISGSRVLATTMKPCALCRQPALLFCESDRASLCWDCDAKVHGANFLVARHTRCLLCRACQEPTPWKASGAQLGRTVSVCDGCARGSCQAHKDKAAAIAAATAAPAAATVSVRGGGGEVARTAPMPAEVREERGRNSSSSSSSEDEDDDDLDDDMATDFDEDDDDEIGTDYDDDEDDDDDDEMVPFEHEPDEDEDGDNQVVPWSTAAEDAPAPAADTEPAPPPATASSCSSDDADYYSHGYESSSPARDRAVERMMMVRPAADGDFDGAGFAKRRMLARGNAPDLTPSYHYQVC